MQSECALNVNDALSEATLFQQTISEEHPVSSTVVIPVWNPRPCGFSHVNTFLKKMNFEIRAFVN